MDSSNCSSAYSHSPQNGFVAAGGHVNLLDTGTGLGHVLQDVLNASSADVVAEAQVDLFQVLRGHANERESHIFVSCPSPPKSVIVYLKVSAELNDQTLTVLSQLPVASLVPSLFQATDETARTLQTRSE